jgi:hypothetical protein
MSSDLYGDMPKAQPRGRRRKEFLVDNFITELVLFEIRSVWAEGFYNSTDGPARLSFVSVMSGMLSFGRMVGVGSEMDCLWDAPVAMIGAREQESLR